MDPDQFARIGAAMRSMDDMCIHFEVTTEDHNDGYRWKVTGFDCTPEDKAFDRNNPLNTDYVEDDDFREDPLL